MFNPNNPNNALQKQMQQQQEQQRRQQEMGAHYEMEKKRKRQAQIRDGIEYGRQQAGVGIHSDGDVNVRGDVIGGGKTENYNVNVPGEEEVERSGCANAILKTVMFGMFWGVFGILFAVGLGALGYGVFQAIGSATGSDLNAEVGAAIGAGLGIIVAFAFALSIVSGKKKKRGY